MKTRSVISLLILGLGRAFAADAGTTSANFLKLGIGPRAIAMGNAQVGGAVFAGILLDYLFRAG